MYLTDEEKQILDGQHGPLKKKSLEFIVRYANVLDAEKLCRVTKAHLFAGAHSYLKTIDLNDIESAVSLMHFCSDEKLNPGKVECFAQTDAGPMDPMQWESLGFSKQESMENELYLDRYLKEGIHIIGSCVPYMLGFIPVMGEHYVSTESHAIIFMNSLWGACANADGIEASFCSAFSGRTPYWGNHIPGQRKGNVFFHIESKVETINDWDLLGFTIGSKCPPFAIPVIEGIKVRPDFEMLRSCFASMATTGGVELCHFPGITPEAPDLKTAFGGKVPKDSIPITNDDIKKTKDFLTSANKGEINFVSLGCPHYSIEQIREVANFLNDKKINSDVELQIWTAYPIKAIADHCGYTASIEKSGGKIFCGSCPILTGKWPQGASGLAFDSAKQANYMKPRINSNIFHGSRVQCLNAAISGKWGH
jgi:hypothetical protein